MRITNENRLVHAFSRLSHSGKHRQAQDCLADKAVKDVGGGLHLMGRDAQYLMAASHIR
jgi:hypothetical protein